MRRHLIRNGWISLATASILLAQATGSKPGGGTAGSAGGVPGNAPLGRTTTPTQPSTTQQPGSGQLDLQRPIYLSGKVTLDDGTPPPEPVNLELVCGGARRIVG